MLRRVVLVRTDVSKELRAVFLRSVRRLLVTASVVPSSQILVTPRSLTLYTLITVALGTF
jgi:Na+-translocating ferredoxin:NAD+ oxidoreductase RnfA subunit